MCCDTAEPLVPEGLSRVAWQELPGSSLCGSASREGRIRHLTVTRHFMPGYSQQSLREKEAARY